MRFRWPLKISIVDRTELNKTKQNKKQQYVSISDIYFLLKKTLVHKEKLYVKNILIEIKYDSILNLN